VAAPAQLPEQPVLTTPMPAKQHFFDTAVDHPEVAVVRVSPTDVRRRVFLYIVGYFDLSP